jgi:cyclic dehypoxanthinyl futalosine synthase
MSLASSALDRAVAGHRLADDEILALYDAPTREIAAAANSVRLARTDPELATYSIGGNIDYTNICSVACGFCNFYRAKHQDDAFTLSFDEIAQRMENIRQLGGCDVLLQGGINPELPFRWYVDLLRFLKRNYPEIHLDAFSPEEIRGMEQITGRDAMSLLAELKDAGLDAMPGAAAEILADEIRERTAPARIKTADWFRITDAAQRLGLHNPWVSMVTGFGESRQQQVRHLVALRGQQDRALARHPANFIAFKVWPARLDYTRVKYKVPVLTAEQIAEEYVRDVAICRLALDNITNHRAVWRTMGFGVAQVALRAGANDLCGSGSINAITAAMAAAGKPEADTNRVPLEQVRLCIRNAGFIPALRDPYYGIVRRDEPAADSQFIAQT